MTGNGYEDKKKGPKEFERDIFFCIKRMLPFSERWGREGERQTDGIMIFGDEKDNYVIASFDPKLTKRSEGYDLDAEEKNKAIHYILDENANDRIKLLTNGSPMNAHIIISNRFDEKQLEGFDETMTEWVKFLKKGNQTISFP